MRQTKFVRTKQAPCSALVPRITGNIWRSCDNWYWILDTGWGYYCCRSESHTGSQDQLARQVVVTITDTVTVSKIKTKCRCWLPAAWLPQCDSVECVVCPPSCSLLSDCSEEWGVRWAGQCCVVTTACLAWAEPRNRWRAEQSLHSPHTARHIYCLLSTVTSHGTQRCQRQLDLLPL